MESSEMGFTFVKKKSSPEEPHVAKPDKDPALTEKAEAEQK